MDKYALLKGNLGFSEKIISSHKFIHSVVAALIVKVDGVESLLFQKRAKNIRQGGEISFPGGKIDESDKDSIDALLRECHEEMGIEREKIEVLGKIGTNISSNGMLIEAYLGKLHIESLNEIKINKDEVEEFFLVPLHYFIETAPRVEKLQTEVKPVFSLGDRLYEFPYKELGLPDRYHKPWSLPVRDVYFYFFNDHVIWGITADIIYDLIKHINVLGGSHDPK